MKQKKLFHLALSLIAAIGFISIGMTNQSSTVEAKSYSDHSLARLKFHHQEILTIDHNRPRFNKKTESEKHGPWQKFSQLDYLSRAHAANALLNVRLMPHGKRTALTYDPTGWHNRRLKSGWLYNRCHLIGYQLTGQNNNPFNLITGTRELNDPDMLKYENEVAAYIKRSRRHYIRYRVTPIYRGNDLLASGVEMEAQSVGSKRLHFNVYIFNEQPGVKINYKTGTSRIIGHTTHKTAARHHSTRPARKHHRRVIHHQKGKISTAKYRVIGNRRSKIYHIRHGENYHMSKKNAVFFKSEAAARAAGYRKAKR